MNFWDWPCEMFFSECTAHVVVGISSAVILLSVAVCMVAIATTIVTEIK